jgi:methyl-accepting chemotaxis protein
MNSIPQPEEPEDLIDRIADALPENVRSDYYREMRHCRSLPKNDEMLRILRAMQFLTLLMERVPGKVVIERERLERLFTAALRTLEQTLKSSEAHQQQLSARLIALPAKIAEGIKPESIADKINESLHQQFIQSTIPETATALAVIAERLKMTSSEFSTAASALGRSYTGAAEEARQAIDNMKDTVSGAARAARSAAEGLSVKFHRAFHRTLYGLTGLALVIGLLLGVLITRWFDTPASQAEHISVPVIQEELPVKHKSKR